MTDDAAMKLKTSNLATEQAKMKTLIADNKKAANQKIDNEKSATKNLKKVTSDAVTALGDKNAALIKTDQADIASLKALQKTDKADIATLKSEHSKQVSENTAMGKLNTK